MTIVDLYSKIKENINLKIIIMKWPKWFPNIPMLDKNWEKPTLVFYPDVIPDTKENIEKILKSEIFYLKFNLFKSYFMNLKKVGIKFLDEIKHYLNEIYRTWYVDIQINWLPFIHFLVREYYISIEENSSVTYEILDFIEKIIKIDFFDINSKDINWNTWLMRIYSYIKEVNEKVKNWNKDLMLVKLNKLEQLFEKNWWIITLTTEQKNNVNELNIEKSQQQTWWISDWYKVNPKHIYATYTGRNNSTWFYERV